MYDILTGGPANPAGPPGPVSPRSPWSSMESQSATHRKHDILHIRAQKKIDVVFLVQASIRRGELTGAPRGPVGPATPTGPDSP